MTKMNRVKQLAVSICAISAVGITQTAIAQIKADGYCSSDERLANYRHSNPSSTYDQTKHPLVMIGGFFAFDSFFKGAGGLFETHYYYQIVEDLRKRGATVIPINLSSFNGIVPRGEQLLAQLEGFRDCDPNVKFNVIGHSGGSPAARYAAVESRNRSTDLIASVTSVHGSNGGLPFADWFRRTLPEGSFSEAALETIVNGFGSAVELLAGYKPSQYPQDVKMMLADYTYREVQEFNQQYPQGLSTPLRHPDATPTQNSCSRNGAEVVDGIRYYSWGGTMSYTNILDPIDAVLGTTGWWSYNGEKNDGLIPQCNSHLGKVIRDDYWQNHVDAQNHILGLRGLQDPKAIYRNHGNRLKSAGL